MQIRRVVGRHEGAVDAIAVRPDGSALYAAARDGSLVEWPLAGGAPKLIARREKHVRALALSPDGTWLVAGARGGDVLRFDLVKGGEPTHPFGAYERSVQALAISPDGSRVLVAGAVETLDLWDPSGARLWGAKPTKWVYSARFAPDGRHFALGRWDGDIDRFDVDALPPNGKHTFGNASFPYQDGPVFDVAFVPRGIVVAGVADDGPGFAVLFDPKEGSILARAEGLEDGVHALAATPDSRWIVGGGNDQAVFVWDADDLSEVGRVQLGQTEGEPRETSHARETLEDYARRWARAGLVLHDENGRPIAFTRTPDASFPSVVEFYSASGAGAIHTVAVHPSGESAYAGTQGGLVVEVDLPARG